MLSAPGSEGERKCCWNLVRPMARETWQELWPKEEGGTRHGEAEALQGGRAPADVVRSVVRTRRGEGLRGGREEAGLRWVRWTGPSVTPGAQENAAPLPCLFPLSLLVVGRADPTFDPWTGDPFPEKVRAVVASKPDSLSRSCIFIVNYVFPGRMEEVRPGASVIQDKETGPHPGKGTEQYQEAHSAVAVPAGD